MNILNRLLLLGIFGCCIIFHPARLSAFRRVVDYSAFDHQVDLVEEPTWWDTLTYYPSEYPKTTAAVALVVCASVALYFGSDELVKFWWQNFSVSSGAAALSAAEGPISSAAVANKAREWYQMAGVASLAGSS